MSEPFLAWFLAPSSPTSAVLLLCPQVANQSSSKTPLQTSSQRLCDLEFRELGHRWGSCPLVAHACGSIIAPFMITALLENHRQKEAVLSMDLLLFLAGLACTLFPHETKGRAIH